LTHTVLYSVSKACEVLLTGLTNQLF